MEEGPQLQELTAIVITFISMHQSNLNDAAAQVVFTVTLGSCIRCSGLKYGHPMSVSTPSLADCVG